MVAEKIVLVWTLIVVCCSLAHARDGRISRTTTPGPSTTPSKIGVMEKEIIEMSGQVDRIGKAATALGGTDTGTTKSTRKVATAIPVPLNKEQIQNIIDQLNIYKQTLINLLEQVDQWLLQLEAFQPILPEAIYNSIKQQLLNLKNLIKYWCNKIEAMIAYWECQLKKACIREDLQTLTNEYNIVTLKIKNLKKKCTLSISKPALPPSKKCISQLQAYKQTLDSIFKKVYALYFQLQGIEQCLPQIQFQFCKNQIRSLIFNINNSIRGIKVCLKDWIKENIDNLIGQFQSLQNAIWSLKLKAQSVKTKEELQNIINLMMNYQSQLQQLKQTYYTLQRCLYSIKNCLLDGDYKECYSWLTSIKIKLDFWCTLVKTCLINLQKQIKIMCIKEELEAKRKELNTLHATFSKLIQGFTFDCRKLYGLLQQFLNLQTQLANCKKELQQMVKELEQLKECKEYSILKDQLDQLINLFNRLCDKVKSSIVFINCLIQFFCKKPTSATYGTFGSQATLATLGSQATLTTTPTPTTTTTTTTIAI